LFLDLLIFKKIPKPRKPMKSKSLTSFALASTLALASVSSLNAATIFTDNASNYGGGWNTGSNGGSGFGAWTLTSSGGTGGFAGSFIGDPTSAGITGMSTSSFGLFANPSGSGAFVDADRSLANPLGIGDSFSFQWGINWDSDGGNKGFNIYSGGVGATQLINVNNGSTSNITINSTDVGFGYGNAAMTWTITRTSATNLQVDATNRAGGAAYSGNVTISGAPDAIRFYASGMNPGDNRQSYFNNLTLTVVPEPSSLSLLALSGLALLRRRRA
jgi:hypothetical protein